MAKTINELNALADAGINETKVSGNKKNRVFGLMKDVVETMQALDEKRLSVEETMTLTEEKKAVVRESIGAGKSRDDISFIKYASVNVHAVANGVVYTSTGYKIPAGSSGQNSQLALKFNEIPLLKAGDMVRYINIITVNNYAAVSNLTFYTDLLSSNNEWGGYSILSVSNVVSGQDKIFTFEMEYVITQQDVDNGFNRWMVSLLNNTAPVSSEVNVTHTGYCYVSYLNSELIPILDKSIKTANENIISVSGVASKNEGSTVDIHLKRSYYGDGYLTTWFNSWSQIQNFIDSTTDASFLKQYTIWIHDDWHFTDRSQLNGDTTSNSTNYAYIVKTKSWINLRAYGGRKTLSVKLPSTATTNDVWYTQPAILHGSINVSGLQFVGANCRYSVHIDSMDRGDNENAIQFFNNCDFIGLKRDTGLEYGDQVTALGIGCSSGHKMYFNGCLISSNGTAIVYHTNKDFTYPTLFSLINCSVSSKTGYWIDCTMLGNNQDAIIELLGNDIQGLMNVKNEWYGATTKNDCRSQTPIVTGSGNSSFMIAGQTKSRVLRFDTTTLGASIVVFGGDAFEIIYGEETQKDGCSDLWGWSYGSIDIADDSGYNGVSLGSRLGNCSTVNKNFGITVNGSFHVLTFNKNYTSMSNSEILSEMNTALTGIATVSEYDITKNYYPMLSDRVFLKKCSSTTTSIVRKRIGDMKIGTIVVEDTLYGVRPATASDTENLLFCLDDVKYSGIDGYVDDVGRCVKSAVFFTWWPFTAYYGSVAIGDKFEIDSNNPGILIKNNVTTRCVAIGVAEHIIKMIK